MKIKILKRTPYRKGYEKEIKIGEIHEVTRVRKKNGSLQPEEAYFFIVDGRERMVLRSDCKIIES